MSSTITGDNVAVQGAPNGPPVQEWEFSKDVQESLKRHNAWKHQHNIPPPSPIASEEEELFCVCNGPDDGSMMVECDNGIFCLKGWFHMRCINMLPPGPPEEEEWFCDRCLCMEKGKVVDYKIRHDLPRTKDLLEEEKVIKGDRPSASKSSNRATVNPPAIGDDSQMCDRPFDLLSEIQNPAERATILKLFRQGGRGRDAKAAKEQKTPKRKRDFENNTAETNGAQTNCPVVPASTLACQHPTSDIDRIES